MGERAVRTRRKPGGGKRREPLGARRRTLRFTGRQTFLLERTRPQLEVFTNHESRDTNHGLFPACFGRRVMRNAGWRLHLAGRGGLEPPFQAPKARVLPLDDRPVRRFRITCGSRDPAADTGRIPDPSQGVASRSAGTNHSGFLAAHGEVRLRTRRAPQQQLRARPGPPWFRRLPPAIQVFRVTAANFRSARRHARTAAFTLRC